MKNPTKTILFSLTALLVFASMLQRQFKLFEFKDLRGVVVEQPMPELSFKNYSEGTFQQGTEEHLKQHFGFRQPMIRLYNQYLWDFYKDTPVSKDQIAFGKDNWFYEPGAVSDYYQTQFRFFASDSTQMASMLSEEAHRLLVLQQALERKGIRLFVCLVPSKDLICPEHLPNDQDTAYVGAPKISARFFNEEEFTRIGLNHLNLEQWFLQVKDTASFALFPQTGTHWTRYASLFAADTLIRYMEHLDSINMKNLVIGPKELDNARNPDDDLENLLNLLRPIRKPKYYYAEGLSDGDTTATKPKMIVIGDSFWWTIAAQIPLTEIFSESPYWYYNSTVYYDDRYHSVSEIDLAEELLSADFVALFYCATQQYRMNDGFSQKALEALGIEDDAVVADSMTFIEREIQRTIGEMLASPELMEMIREKATKYNKTIDKALRDDAHWIVNYKIQQGTLKWPGTTKDTNTKTNNHGIQQ